MDLLKWLKNIAGKKSEKELLDELHGHFLTLNKILDEGHGSLSGQLKTQLNSFSSRSTTVCTNLRRSYPTINLMDYKTWIQRIVSLSGRFLEQCAQIEERRARVRYEESLVKINDTAEDLLKIVEGYTKKTA